MSKFIIRLDDASDYMDLQKWNQMETLLDKYEVKPIFGIIPKNADITLTSCYKQNPDFWNMMHSWVEKGWVPALHGYEHRYVTEDCGINPVNNRSEFAGLSYEEQAMKIRLGYQILVEHGIMPKVFFAPSHTFDENTLKAIKNETSIRIISDTVANKPYRKYGFTFIPQQSGRVRMLPFNTVTFCYHPNTMKSIHFDELSRFIEKHKNSFDNSKIDITDRKENAIDKLLRFLYFIRR